MDNKQIVLNEIEEQCKKIFNLYDTDKNGILSFKGFNH